MLRHTGPGKIRDVLAPDKKSDTTIIGILYNFDIDGDAVKPEHRAWLTEHVAPQLGDASVKVILKGETSRSGSADYNLELSKRRLRNVEAFLRKDGDVSAKIETTAFGEAVADARGEADKTEDENFRAVIVRVEQSAHRFVAPVFTADTNPRGFDPSADPPWLMLPAGSGFRHMRITNGEGLTIVSSNPGVVRVRSAINFSGSDRPVVISQQSEIFRVFPGITADATISAVDSAGRVHARIAVSVLAKRTVKCAFHFIRNENYGSSRPLSDVPDFMSGLNDVWESQANIVFDNGGRVNEIKMTANLGTRIDTDAKFEAVASTDNAGVQFNVFFVKDVWSSPTEDVIGLTEFPGGKCLFDDAPDFGDDNRKPFLAHEAGHALSLDHDSPTVSTDQNLMQATTPDREMGGMFLSKAQVLQARRNTFR